MRCRVARSWKRHCQVLLAKLRTSSAIDQRSVFRHIESGHVAILMKYLTVLYYFICCLSRRRNKRYGNESLIHVPSFISSQERNSLLSFVHHSFSSKITYNEYRNNYNFYKRYSMIAWKYSVGYIFYFLNLHHAVVPMHQCVKHTYMGVKLAIRYLTFMRRVP